MCTFNVFLVFLAIATSLHVSSAKRTDAAVAAKLIANETYDSTDDKKVAQNTFCWGAGVSHVRCNEQNYVKGKLRGTLHSCSRAGQWGRSHKHPGFSHGALKIAGLATSTDDPFVCVERCSVTYDTSTEERVRNSNKTRTRGDAQPRKKGLISSADLGKILNGVGDVYTDSHMSSSYKKIPNKLVYRTGNAAETRCVAEAEIRGKVTDPVEEVLKTSPFERLTKGLEKLNEEKEKNARERKLMTREREITWAAEYQKIKEEGIKLYSWIGNDDMKFVLQMMGISLT